MTDIDLVKRKPDGGLAEWIEILEAGDNQSDAVLLCLLLELRRFRQDKPALIQQLEAAQRERDECHQRLANAEYQLEMAELAKFNLRGQRKAQFRKRRAAEAELKRRDDALPDDRIIDDGCDQYIGEIQQSDRLNCVWPVGTKFYADAPAAVPSDGIYKIANHIAGAKGSLPEDWQHWAEEIECDLRALGCQPEKVVKLPFKVETSNVPFAAYTWNAAIEECIKALDAAGVKWVEVE